MERGGVQHESTVEGFGQEWETFDQSALDESDLRAIFEAYFTCFPWDSLPQGARGADIGCGTGRWAQFVALRVGSLTCIDASRGAVEVARRRLHGLPNVTVEHRVAGALDIADASLDFAYSLGVLHHTPDPPAALRDCILKLRPGAPFLLYLYYAFDNRPRWFRATWRVSDAIRRLVSALPFTPRYWVSQAIAAVVYWPLARAARLAERFGAPARLVELVPLSLYRDKRFYVMRNDALDRFGTKLEHRFTQPEMRSLMEQAGLTGIEFSDGPPYWVAVGRRSA